MSSNLAALDWPPSAPGLAVESNIVSVGGLTGLEATLGVASGGHLLAAYPVYDSAAGRVGIRIRARFVEDDGLPTDAGMPTEEASIDAGAMADARALDGSDGTSSSPEAGSDAQAIDVGTRSVDATLDATGAADAFCVADATSGADVTGAADVTAGADASPGADSGNAFAQADRDADSGAASDAGLRSVGATEGDGCSCRSAPSSGWDSRMQCGWWLVLAAHLRRRTRGASCGHRSPKAPVSPKSPRPGFTARWFKSPTSPEPLSRRRTPPLPRPMAAAVQRIS